MMKLVKNCSVLVAVLVALSVCVVLAAAPVPDRLDAIPVFPGYVADDSASGDGLVQLFGSVMREEFETMVLVRKSTKVFANDLTREEIAASDLVGFYRARIGGDRIGRDGKVSSWPRKAVRYIAEPEGVFFYWFVEEPGGDLTRLSVSLPPSLQNGSTGRFRSLIIVSSRTYTKRENIKTKIPGIAELGWPVFPGALFEPRESVTGGAGPATYVFYSGEARARVVAFYEGALRCKAGTGEPSPGRINHFFQRAPGPIYETDSILVEEETGSDGTVRTKITYTKQ